MNAARRHIRLAGMNQVRHSIVMMRGNSKGFSIVEPSIIVTIILITAAIVIPNFARSRVAASQASAVGLLRTLNTAEFTYASTYGKGYSATLGYWGSPPPASRPIQTMQGLVTL